MVVVGGGVKRDRQVHKGRQKYGSLSLSRFIRPLRSWTQNKERQGKKSTWWRGKTAKQSTSVSVPPRRTAIKAILHYSAAIFMTWQAVWECETDLNPRGKHSFKCVRKLIQMATEEIHRFVHLLCIKAEL